MAIDVELRFQVPDKEQAARLITLVEQTMSGTPTQLAKNETMRELQGILNGHARLVEAGFVEGKSTRGA